MNWREEIKYILITVVVLCISVLILGFTAQMIMGLIGELNFIYTIGAVLTLLFYTVVRSILKGDL